jgi:hypothetical protein
LRDYYDYSLKLHEDNPHWLEELEMKDIVTDRPRTAPQAATYCTKLLKVSAVIALAMWVSSLPESENDKMVADSDLLVTLIDALELAFVDHWLGKKDFPLLVVLGGVRALALNSSNAVKMVAHVDGCILTHL